MRAWRIRLLDIWRPLNGIGSARPFTAGPRNGFAPSGSQHEQRVSADRLVEGDSARYRSGDSFFGTRRNAVSQHTGHGERSTDSNPGSIGRREGDCQDEYASVEASREVVHDGVPEVLV